MSTAKKMMGLMFSGLVVIALGLGGYWLVQRTAPSGKCPFDHRDVHPEAKAVLEIDGKREVVCCIRCGLTVARQRQKPLRVMEVTDFTSRRPLNPEAAYYVKGSQVILCETHEPLMDHTKQPSDRVFDRCEPSVYAFARREDAEAFAASNGGTVRRLPQILEEVQPRP